MNDLGNLSYQELQDLFDSDETTLEELRELAELHLLNLKETCRCDLCVELGENPIYMESNKCWGNSFDRIYNLIVLHDSCDIELRDDIVSKIYEFHDGDDSFSLLQALFSSPETETEFLEKYFYWTPGLVIKVMRHPNLTPELEKKILEDWGHDSWPTEEEIDNNLEY